MKIHTIAAGFASIFRDAEGDLTAAPTNLNFAGETARTTSGQWKAIPASMIGQVRTFPRFDTRREAAQALIDGIVF